jgi:CO/xanthine dehydrogenase Mo-binding subunit
VDTDTGQIKLLNVICAIDVGKAINPQQLEGQIEGCVVQVMGHALMENLIQKDGAGADKEVVNVFDPDGAGYSRQNGIGCTGNT